MSVGQRIDMVAIVCQRCTVSYNMMTAEWCTCIDRSRTLVCPHCGSCFCTAPTPYKRAVWARAPRELRESPRRFGRTERREAALIAPVVLIVDDDESIRSFVACVVEQLGYRTIATGDPLEAIVLAQSPSVEVVISDVLMPKMDGRELCRTIKESGGDSKKVVLMTSLYRGRQYQIEAFKAFRCDEYLVKPVDVDKLAAAMHHLAPLPQSGKTSVDVAMNG